MFENSRPGTPQYERALSTDDTLRNSKSDTENRDSTQTTNKTNNVGTECTRNAIFDVKTGDA